MGVSESRECVKDNTWGFGCSCPPCTRWNPIPADYASPRLMKDFTEYHEDDIAWDLVGAMSGWTFSGTATQTLCRAISGGDMVYIAFGPKDPKIVKCGYTSMGTCVLFNRYCSRFGRDMTLITFRCNDQEDEFAMHSDLTDFLATGAEWYHRKYEAEIVKRVSKRFTIGAKHTRDGCYLYWNQQLTRIRQWVRFKQSSQEGKEPEKPDFWDYLPSRTQNILLDKDSVDRLEAARHGDTLESWRKKISDAQLNQPKMLV